MSSADVEQRQPAHGVLLDVARRSIETGLERGEALTVDPADFDSELGLERATFVTLRRGGQLRGCMGALVASRPLVADVAQSAFLAAFRDPRFSPLGSAELAGLEIHISVLSPLEPLAVHSEAELLEVIRPGVDGLLLRDGARQGTFLPAVWESLGEPREFVRELKLKAGLPPGDWSPHWEVLRYSVESIPEKNRCT